MSIYHTLNGKHQIDAVNHFIAVIEDGEIVAVYNTKRNTVQIFNESHTPIKFVRVVKFNSQNDARCMFPNIATPAVVFNGSQVR